MPELAFGYLIGFISTAGLVALHIFLQIRKQKSSEMRTLQANLKQIQLYWSDSEANVKDYTEGAEKKDLQQSIRSILISGVGFAFLSWLGFIFQFVVMLSLRYLAVKRLERNLFASDLSEKALNPEISREIVKKIMQS